VVSLKAEKVNVHKALLGKGKDWPRRRDYRDAFPQVSKHTQTSMH